MPLIGAANPAEGIEAGKLAWPHGFHLRRVDFEPGAGLAPHARREQEVLYLFRGALAFEWADGALELAPGDVLTVPVGLEHGYRAVGADPVSAYVVRGGDQPAAPSWRAAERAAAASTAR